MARRGTRSRRANGIFSRGLSPVRHAFKFGDEAVGQVTGVARNVVGSTIRGVDGIVGSFGSHANQAVSNLFVGKSKGKSRKNGKNRKNRSNRKGGATTRRSNRKNTRRNRRTNRK